MCRQPPRLPRQDRRSVCITSTHPTGFLSYRGGRIVPGLGCAIPRLLSVGPSPEIVHCPTAAARLRFLSRSSPVLLSTSLAPPQRRSFFRRSRERRSAQC